MDNQNLILFTEHLLKTFQQEKCELRKMESLDPELPPIYLLIFKDYPEQELITFVTYGLSEMTHPKWHFGRPELLLSVDSENETWGVGLAAIVNRFRGKKRFSYGSTYLLDMPLTDESEMAGFVLFRPSFLSSDDVVFQLPGKTVYLVQAYPIYPGEAELIAEKGFETFWRDEALEDVYDVGRNDISKK